MKLRALLVIMSLAISLIPVAMISGLQNIQIATAFLFLIMVVTFVASYVISYFIIRPLGKLTRNIDQISKGNLDVQLERSEIEEINQLTESLDRVMASLKLAIHKVGVKKEEIFEQAERARAEAECKYRHLLQTLDGWVWEVSPDGRCFACTEKVAAALGQPADAVVGKDMAMFFDAARCEAVRRQLHEMATSNRDMPLTCEQVMRHADGHLVSVRTQIIPMKDVQGKITAFYCYSQDVSDSQNALAQIEQLTDKLKALNTDVHSLFHVTAPPASASDSQVPSGTDFMVLFTDDLRILDCSQGLSDHLGCPRDDVLRQGLAELFTFPEYRSVKEALEAVKQKGVLLVTLAHRRKDGSVVQTAGILEYIKDKNLFQYRPDF